MLTALVGCTSARYALLTAPAMSMNRPSVAADEHATAAGPVEAEYCTDDEPVVSRDANVGLIDEAVAKAERQSGAKYLTDVTVFSDGDCVSVEAAAMK